jgi:hypothetical protein
MLNKGDKTEHLRGLNPTKQRKRKYKNVLRGENLQCLLTMTYCKQEKKKSLLLCHQCVLLHW